MGGPNFCGPLRKKEFTMSIGIKIDHVKKMYGKNTVIPDLSLEVKPGEFFTLLGSSGCGKTTLLRMIAGFNSIEGGEIYFDDKKINDIAIYKRNIGMVFQNYAVFPHMSVYQNVAYGLKQRHLPKEEIESRVMAMLKEVQIENLKDRYPSDMSGGQQQRIALARAIVIRPDVLLFDEPLSNLDAKLRVEMRLVIKRLQNANKITTIYVTHDQEEALSMSDRIAIMKNGVIQQVGTPYQVFNDPVNLFVATFIGQSNIFEGTLKQGKGVASVVLPTGEALPVARKVQGENNRAVKAVIRPTDFAIKEGKGDLSGTVKEKIFLGTEVRYTVLLSDAKEVEVHVSSRHPTKNVGDSISLSVNASTVNVFRSDSGDSLMEEKA